eukprot:668083-Rhodomonas_salina.1
MEKIGRTVNEAAGAVGREWVGTGFPDRLQKALRGTTRSSEIELSTVVREDDRCDSKRSQKKVQNEKARKTEVR